MLYNSLNAPGLSSRTNNSTPPDSTGAIGPANYVEIVNSELAVWHRSDLSAASSSPLNTFIGDSTNPSSAYCDPQVQWDPSANRWLFSFLFCNTSSTVQGFIFGWSKTSDPTNLTVNTNLASGWCAFGVRTDPNLLDYPKLGHNSKYLIVGGNFYDENPPSASPPFVTAAIFWIPKPANGDTSCTTPASLGQTTGTLKNFDGTNAFTPVPVNTITGSTDGYIVSAHDPSGSNSQPAGSPTSQNMLAVWHLDSAGVLHPPIDIRVASYVVPSLAPQLNGTSLIDTLDGRLTQAVGDPAGGIWTQHTVGSPSGRSEMRWYEIKVAGSVASLAQEGNIASATDWIFNGAISPTFDGLGAAAFYSRSGTAIDPVIAGQVRFSSTAAGAMEPGELVMATSAGADTDFSCNFNNSGAPCRWGDYSGATPDPVHTDAVWGTNEFIAPVICGLICWADENFAVAILAPPTGVAATAGDRNALVTWTPPPTGAATPVTGYTIKAYVGASMVKSMVVPAPTSNALFLGLTNGVTYTFTVTASAGGDSSPESANSNPVTPSRAVAQATPSTSPARQPVNQSTPTPPPLR